MKNIFIAVALAVLCTAFVLGCAKDSTGPGSVEAEGTLTVTVDFDTPLAQQLVMGEVNREVARFKFQAGPAQDILISSPIVSDSLSSGYAAGTFKNLRIVDVTTSNSIGGPVQLNPDGTSYAHAVFSGSSLVIPKGTSKVFSVEVEVSTAGDGAVSGSTHALRMSVTAVGLSSGQPVKVTYGRQTANLMTVYRTTILVEWASDSPSGSAIGSSAQTIAKVRITNVPNPGNYAAIIKVANLGLSTTISNTADRCLNVYKDAPTGTPLATINRFSNGRDFGDTNITDAGFTDVEIPAGQTRTFYFPLDTTDGNRIGDFSLAVRINQGGIVWDDGSGAEIHEVMSLPLIPKTLTY